MSRTSLCMEIMNTISCLYADLRVLKISLPSNRHVIDHHRLQGNHYSSFHFKKHLCLILNLTLLLAFAHLLFVPPHNIQPHSSQRLRREQSFSFNHHVRPDLLCLSTENTVSGDLPIWCLEVLWLSFIFFTFSCEKYYFRGWHHLKRNKRNSFLPVC